MKNMRLGQKFLEQGNFNSFGEDSIKLFQKKVSQEFEEQIKMLTESQRCPNYFHINSAN